MLVLSRQRDEGVTISIPGFEPIHVVLVEIRGDKARLGFDAPKEITVHRDEVQEAIDRASGRRQMEKLAEPAAAGSANYPKARASEEA